MKRPKQKQHSQMSRADLGVGLSRGSSCRDPVYNLFLKLGGDDPEIIAPMWLNPRASLQVDPMTHSRSYGQHWPLTWNPYIPAITATS